jgi:hypothetical protein
LDQETLIDSLKRPNSKWVISEIYEYILLTTPLPNTPMGALVRLPDFIKNSKSIIGFENVPDNLCFWYCLAHHKNKNHRLDRLASKVKELFHCYYKNSSTKDYLSSIQ